MTNWNTLHGVSLCTTEMNYMNALGQGKYSKVDWHPPCCHVLTVRGFGFMEAEEDVSFNGEIDCRFNEHR